MSIPQPMVPTDGSGRAGFHPAVRVSVEELRMGGWLVDPHTRGDLASACSGPLHSRA